MNSVENQDFYDSSSYGNRLIPGNEIKIEQKIFFQEAKADISALAALTIEELQSLREESAINEKKLFENLIGGVKVWEQQAAQTLLIDKSIEYLKTPAVKHTSNQWSVNEYGNQEISNMVDKMHYNIYEETKWDRQKGQSVPTAWYLTWGIRTNTPRQYASGTNIAGQERKRFTDKAEMEKYLNGRKAAYANYFTEISPIIPKKYVRHFCVNNLLLPGYIAEGTEKTAEHIRQTPGSSSVASVMEQIIASRNTAQSKAEKPDAPKKAHDYEI